MNLTISPLKQEAIRLRVEKRMSFAEISRATGLAKSTLSGWLRQYPLSSGEITAKVKAAQRYVAPKKSHGEESKHHRVIDEQKLLPQQKGKIAEIAVLFRLALHGYEVYKSFFDGDKYDCIVEVSETGYLLKLQVRWLAPPAYGLPAINLRCADGHYKRRRYREDEFDFIVGYYLFNDTAYIYSFDEVADKKTNIAVADEHAERWDKLKDFTQPAAPR